MKAVAPVIYFSTLKSPLGELRVYATEFGLSGLCLPSDEVPALYRQFKNLKNFKNEIIKAVEEQLDLYFAKRLKKFDLPLDLQGTEFQISVWRELLKIPYGQLRSYSEHAEALKKEKAVRAVGSAIGKNPIAIIVPCHRVIAKGGIGGYGGGLKIKTWLLKHEGVKMFDSQPEQLSF